jgi:hypothetical protein
MERLVHEPGSRALLQVTTYGYPTGPKCMEFTNIDAQKGPEGRANGVFFGFKFVSPGSTSSFRAY